MLRFSTRGAIYFGYLKGGHFLEKGRLEGIWHLFFSFWYNTLTKNRYFNSRTVSLFNIAFREKVEFIVYLRSQSIVCVERWCL